MGRTNLVVDAIGDVEQLEEHDKQHRVGAFTATAHSLLACGADVDETPQHETRPELVEGLEVQPSERRVQLASDEELLKVRLEGE